MSNEIELIYARISDKAYPPQREPGSVGYDVFSFGDHTLSPNETKIIPLGFYAALPENYGAFVWDRSSFGAKGLHIFRQLITNNDYLKENSEIITFGGAIDGGYRGQWGIILHNFLGKIVGIAHGQKIAQFVIQECLLPKPKEITIEEFEKLTSIRGAKGLGCSDGQNTAETAQKLISNAGNLKK